MGVQEPFPERGGIDRPEETSEAAPARIAAPTSAAGMTPSAHPQVAEEASALAPEAIAMVNGTPVWRAAYDEQLGQARSQLLSSPVPRRSQSDEAASQREEQLLVDLQDQVLNWMIDQVLIEQAAAAMGVEAPGDRIDRRIVAMKGQDTTRFESWLAASGMTMESLRHQVRMDILTAAVGDLVTSKLARSTEQYHVRHILLSEVNRAQDVRTQLADGGNFIALARQFSEDAVTRDLGGDLGFMPRGVMPPAFEEAVFALRPGETSGVVQTTVGLHIIQLLEIDPERRISDEHWSVVQQRAFEDWLVDQRSQAVILR